MTMQHPEPPVGSPPPSGPRPPTTGPGEVLFEGVCNHTVALGGYLKWFLVCVLGGAVAYGLAFVPQVASYPLWVLGFVGVPGMLWEFLKHKTTRYRVTDRRVEFERGVFAKQVDSVELWRVLDVRYGQSLFDRVLGNGKITLTGIDRSHPDFVLYGLPHHRRLFEQLRDAVQASRQVGRPLEFIGDFERR